MLPAVKLIKRERHRERERRGEERRGEEKRGEERRRERERERERERKRERKGEKGRERERKGERERKRRNAIRRTWLIHITNTIIQTLFWWTSIITATSHFVADQPFLDMGWGRLGSSQLHPGDEPNDVSAARRSRSQRGRKKLWLRTTGKTGVYSPMIENYFPNLMVSMTLTMAEATSGSFFISPYLNTCICMCIYIYSQIGKKPQRASLPEATTRAVDPASEISDVDPFWGWCPNVQWRRCYNLSK